MAKFIPAPFWVVVTTLLHHGHFAAEPRRSAFVFHLLCFADLDSYPGRAELAAAFSPAGTLTERCRQAAALARAGYLDENDYSFAIARAAETAGGCRHG